ncbi:MAG: glycosyltransferase family 4 protein [Candidatus Ratteibacteria bacterium]
MWNIIYAGVFLVSLCFSLLLVPVVRRFALAFNVIDQPSSRKIHLFPTPLSGGIAIYLSLLATVMVGLIAKEALPEGIFSHSAGIMHVLPKLTIFLATSAVVVVFGFLDDMYHLMPMVKLGFQIICGIITFLAGIRISFFAHYLWVQVIFTIGWIVVCMNSFNLLDHTNGLASGVACIAGGIFFFYAVSNGQLFISTLLACFIGAVLGFMPYNFPKAKIFLGECGSSFLGYFLACLGMMGTYYRYGPHQSMFPALSPVLIFSVPFFDTLSVIYLRIKNRKPVFQADKNHIYHRLVNLGMNQVQAVIYCYLLTFATGLGALLLNRLDIIGGMIVFSQAVLILICAAMLESTGRKNG